MAAHEFGHVLEYATFGGVRSGVDPWQPLRLGGRRWATYEHVCSGVAAGTLLPGAEDLANWPRNPGEAWADTYAAFAAARNGWMNPAGWAADPSLLPDAQALALAGEDALDPWKQQVRWSTFAMRPGESRRFVVPTPVDGGFAIEAGGSASVRLDDPDGHELAAGTGYAATNLCGVRQVTVTLATRARPKPASKGRRAARPRRVPIAVATLY